MTIFPIILGTLAILIQNSAAQGQFAQRAILRDSNGESISTNDYEADLNNKGFNNRAVSICVTGVWMVYEHTNFNTGSSGVMEFIFGPQNSTGPNCFQFRDLKRRVSSIRYTGSPHDYRADTITLFQKDHFQGAEEYTLSELPNLYLADNHTSLIITGSSSWTVYELPNYRGNARCVGPPQSDNFEPAFIYNVQNIGILANTIKSLRKGCYA